MFEVVLQYWEESERGVGVRLDGCSLHLDITSCNSYIRNIYDSRDYEDVPYEYDRVVGNPILIDIDKNLFDILKKELVIRLSQVETNNLFTYKKITTD